MRLLRRLRDLLIPAVGCLAALLSPSLMADDLRIGIIGLDTSHSEQFTLRLNDPANPNHIPGARVVVAFPGGSPDIEESKSRIEGFTATVRDKFGVRIVASVEEVCKDVDAVLLLSLEGRPRLEQMRKIIAAGKPVFMDKPVAASLKDVVEIYELAAAAQVPVFSASAVRWYPGVLEVANAEPTPARGVISYGPAHVLPHHPDLFFYGVHPTESLFTVMGSGCLSVTRTTTPSESVVTGLWSEGRTGTLVAIHEGAMSYKVIRFGDTQITEQKSEGDYTPMLREIVKFFQTKLAPVTPRQTMEIYAFMAAAEESKHRDGARVTLREVMVKAGAPEAWLPEDGTAKPKPSSPKSVPKGLPKPGAS
ncbi:Gfo/Idh/MocA family oxidoreductase [Prosthecobacter sp.]|uniref:Gfo/Idh/MocA family protein n=1 Tax=Prosthecobacter sp. TaxID=1965333 RepID=UPI00248737C2|nr:Gfo/Idh/MocA family oxidoreductase [Prosthecobacter sp.]MDI1313765.1 Gfo/Idh/MocA family oxidoreductase [Prosthecobacter sp.]